MNELEKAIKRLEALREEAFYISTHRRGASADNRAGQYLAYHKAVEIIKAAMRKDNTPGCICCGNTIPEGRQVCPKCEVGAGDGK